MSFSNAGHVARLGAGHPSSDDDDGSGTTGYTSVTEHPLAHCYKYKTTIEHKQCVKDMYDEQFSGTFVVGLCLLSLLLISIVIGVSLNAK